MDWNPVSYTHLEQLEKQKNVEIQYCARIDRITKTEKSFVIRLEDGTEYETSFVLNASYASVNQILQKLENVGTEKFKIKYEPVSYTHLAFPV